jgi:hypothetical protein
MMKGLLKSSFRPRWVLLTLVALVCVLGLTHIPGPDMPRILEAHALDKAEHVVAYGSIAGFFLLSLKGPMRPVLLLLGLIALAGIAALDETTQPFVDRTCDLWDFSSDLVGITIPCVVAGIAKRWRSHATPSRG